MQSGYSDLFAIANSQSLTKQTWLRIAVTMATRSIQLADRPTTPTCRTQQPADEAGDDGDPGVHPGGGPTGAGCPRRPGELHPPPLRRP